jgi:5,10-methylene-tetrahydrofolate dehydrogenase/methenyl tetrahydrofolate cyclohydrolase
VGENPASQVYVSSKGKQTVKAGINQPNTDPAVHGILPESNGLIA